MGNSHVLIRTEVLSCKIKNIFLEKIVTCLPIFSRKCITIKIFERLKMWKATGILFLVCVITWLLTYANEKWKGFAKVITFLSIGSLVLSIINFSTGYDPLMTIKEHLGNFNLSKDDQISTEMQPQPFEVLIPKEGHTTTSTNDVSSVDIPPSVYEPATVILNIEEKAHRNDENEIFFIWVPIAGQNEYKLKIEVDDPFSSAEKALEYTCKDFYQYVDVSAYDRDTVMFASVGVWSENEDKWIYTDPINFTLI